MKSTSVIKGEKGSTLIIFLFMMAMLSALAMGALNLAALNLEENNANRKHKKAFYAAEAGLEFAVNEITESFNNLEVYTTSAQNGGDADGFITGSNYRGYEIKYKITNPESRYLYKTIKGNNILSHYGYTYEIESYSKSLTDNTRESLLEKFRVLETPLVQWFAFYGGDGGNDSDLEITPYPGMVTWGRVHSNADIWLRAGSGGQLRFQNFDPNGGSPIPSPHSITAVGSIRNMHKGSGGVSAVAPQIKISNSSLLWEDFRPINFVMDDDAQEEEFNQFVFVNESLIQAPGNSQFQRGGFYEDRSVDPKRNDVSGIQILGQGEVGSGTNVFVSQPSTNTDVTTLIKNRETSPGNYYPGPWPIITETNGSLQDCRENDSVDTTNIDLYALELWYAAYLADESNNTVVIGSAGFLVYASRSPDATFDNTGDPMQAIRLITIGSGSRAQLLNKTTFASDNPIYIQRDFNTINTKGAAIIGDAINFLGNNWFDSNKSCGVGIPSAGDVGDIEISVRAALFGGYSPTIPGGNYGGGLHNYMRYHEDWGGIISDFKGSLIGLWTNQQATGNWCQGGGNCYQPPIRNWGWDTRFADPEFWPPFIPSIYGIERLGVLENFKKGEGVWDKICAYGCTRFD